MIYLNLDEKEFFESLKGLIVRAVDTRTSNAGAFLYFERKTGEKFALFLPYSSKRNFYAK